MFAVVADVFAAVKDDAAVDAAVEAAVKAAFCVLKAAVAIEVDARAVLLTAASEFAAEKPGTIVALIVVKLV